ncbi:MAG: hypothetical protein ACI85O_001655 [Saprospiraceae bacterium]|jgi:hypothetical protein
MDNLLVNLFKSLKKEEIRQLKKYVRSPIVTHRNDIGQMFNCLADCFYKRKELPNKAELYIETYGEEIFDDQKLRSTMSDLHKIIEEFLVWRIVKEDDTERDLLLLRCFRQRNQQKHFQKTQQRILKSQAKQPLRNPDYYDDQLRYQAELAKFQAANQRAGNLHLQEIGDTMDILYLSRKLRHACTQLSHRAVYKTDYDFGLLKEWIVSLKDSVYLEVPAVALYYYCYLFLTEEYSQQYFRKFRESLFLHNQHFPKDELKDLYRAAINFCIRKLNEGSSEFTLEGWELFQEGLKSDIFTENGQLSRFTFDNIVGFGLRLKKHGEVEKFIENYQIQLSENYQENTVKFNFARLEYDRKNFDKAVCYLQTFQPMDLVNQLISRTLLLKIYYESEEFDLLESHLDSFRLFIRRKDVSDYHRTNFQNIISFVRKQLSLPPGDRTERTKLRKAIEEELILTEREWLLGNLQ